MLKPGGSFGATTFHSDNSSMFWIPDFVTSFASFPFDAPFPDHVPMQTHKCGVWTDPTWVEAHLRDQGVEDVRVQTNLGSYFVHNADEFVSTFGMMISLMMNTHWTEETRKRHPLSVVKELMKKHLMEKYQGQGWTVSWKSISMTGRAPT